MNFVVWVHDPDLFFGTNEKSTERVKNLFDALLRPATGERVTVTALTGALITEESAKTIYEHFRSDDFMELSVEAVKAIDAAHDDVAQQLRYLDPDWLEEMGEWDDD